MKLKHYILTILFCCTWFVVVKAQHGRSSLKNSKPNVIYILADDLGRGLLSHYGQKIIKTPNIDRLADEGVSFDNVYSSAYCAPARATFLTGYNDCKPGKYILTSGAIYAELAKGSLTDEKVQEKVDATIGKEPDITYLPQIFKKAGYVTGQVGKLDWGFSTTTKQMNNHGWDYYYGYYDHQQCHGFYPMFLHETGKLVNIPGNTRPDAGKTGEWGSTEGEKDRWNMDGKTVYSQDLFLDKILKFIRTNKNKPFFLLHSTQLPHGPVSIPAIHPDFVFNSKLSQIEKEYASMVKRLDDDVAVIMQELKKLGIDKNTIVVFTSDNGHEIYYSLKGRIEKPYKNMKSGELFNDYSNVWYSGLGGDVFDGNDGMASLKRSNYDGGVKVPLFIHWPKQFATRKVVSEVVTNYDFFSTMTDLLKVQTKDKKDGISYLSALTGNKKFKGHDYIAYSSFVGAALVSGDGWKLRHFAPKDTFQLFYLPNDYQERNDLAYRYPEKVKALKEILKAKCSGDLNNGWFSDGKNVLTVR